MQIEKYEIVERTEFQEKLGDYILFRDIDQKFINECDNTTLMDYFDIEGFAPEHIMTIQNYFDNWYDVMCPDQCIDQSFLDIWKVLYEGDVAGELTIVKCVISGWEFENVVLVILHEQ